MLLTSHLGKVMEKIKVKGLVMLSKEGNSYHYFMVSMEKNGLISLFRIRNKESSGKRNTGNSGK